MVIQSCKVGVIIPAAGIGKRVGQKIPKQYLEIQGKPILVYTLEKFEKCDLIDEVILVCGKTYIEKIKQFVKKYNLLKINQIVPGSELRQDSVANGLNVLSDSIKTVLVHDAVRPFVSIKKIEEVIKTVWEFGAAFLAISEKNTVWEAKNGLVTQFLNRETIWEAQTPQGFRVDWLQEGYQKAKEDHYYGTDEVSLVKRLGYPIRVIPGDEKNIKITTPLDLQIGNVILGDEA